VTQSDLYPVALAFANLCEANRDYERTLRHERCDAWAEVGRLQREDEVVRSAATVLLSRAEKAEAERNEARRERDDYLNELAIVLKRVETADGALAHERERRQKAEAALAAANAITRYCADCGKPGAAIIAATNADAEVLRAAQRVDGVTAFVFEAVAGHEERSVMRALSRATISGPSDNTPTAAITALRAVVDCAEDSVFGEEFESCENGCDCCICGARKVLAE